MAGSERLDATAFLADPRRRGSREVDLGVHWRERGSTVRWRVSWIEETGELYAVAQERGQVEVLGTFATEQAVEQALRGWASVCGQPASLNWARAAAAGRRLDLDVGLVVYAGTIGADGRRVEVLGEPGGPRPLVHQVRHSPTGMAWGYRGSGPADLARSLLADRLGFVPPPWAYQAFTSDVVARLEMDRPFTLAAEDVDVWLQRHYPLARRIADRRAQLHDELAALDERRIDLLQQLDQLDHQQRRDGLDRDLPAGPDLSRP